MLYFTIIVWVRIFPPSSASLHYSCLLRLCYITKPLLDVLQIALTSTYILGLYYKGSSEVRNLGAWKLNLVRLLTILLN